MKIKVVAVLSLLCIFSCQKSEESEYQQHEIDDVKKGGIAITFDDNYIYEWQLAHSKLTETNWKATFCVSKINLFTTEEIEQLHELQNAGHEISGHGLKHLNAVNTINAVGAQNYIDEEIVPMLDIMDKESLYVSSFAYPYGSRNTKTDAVLLNYFDIVRGTTYGNPKPENHHCYFNYQKLVFGIGIDSNYSHFSEKYLLDLLSYAKEESKILIVYAHKPMQEVTEDYQVSMATLNLICEYIAANDMQYYTLSDLIEMIE